MSIGARSAAIHGPWEQHTYDLWAGLYAIYFHDSTGEKVLVCEHWDRDFGDLLEKAWAVPELVQLLRDCIAWFNGSADDYAQPEVLEKARDLLERIG